MSKFIASPRVPKQTLRRDRFFFIAQEVGPDSYILQVAVFHAAKNEPYGGI